MPREAVIAVDGFMDLEQTMGGDEEGNEAFQVIKNLVEVALLSNFKEKVSLIEPALSGYMGTPVEVLTMCTESQRFAYIRLNGLEDATFYVGKYPIERAALESAPTEREMNALHALIAARTNNLPMA